MKFAHKKKSLKEEINETSVSLTKSEKETPKKRKFVNKVKTKYGTYAIVISAIVIVVAIGLNVLFGVLAKRVNLDLDISLKGENTLNKENIEFLKSIDKPVTITVCSTREEYVSYMDKYNGDVLGISSANPTDYYEQSLRFLDLYKLYSNNITVKFLDLQDPAFADVVEDFSASEFFYGDFIVSAKHTVNGEEVERKVLVNYDDIYYLSNPYGANASYYAMMMGTSKMNVVQGSNFESAVSGAIRKVISTETKKVGIIQTHCNITNAQYFDSKILNINNFDVEVITDKIITSIPDEYSLLIITAPKEDFAVSELDVIEEWLDNNGNKGRGLLYFAAPTQKELPNLFARLEEWGIKIGSGVLYDTGDETAWPYDPTLLFLKPDRTCEESGRAQELLKGTSQYLATSIVPITTTFETEGDRTTFVPVLTSGEEVVVRPIDADNTWTPGDDDVFEQRAGVIVSYDEVWENSKPKTSYIIAFASSNFISQEIIEYHNIAGNINISLNAAKLAASVDESADAFESLVMREFENETYTVNAKSAKVMTIIFQWVIPVSLILCGIIVFIRRIRR